MVVINNLKLDKPICSIISSVQNHYKWVTNKYVKFEFYGKSLGTKIMNLSGN